MRSSYHEFGDFNPLDLVLVYLHTFPHPILNQIYHRVLKEMKTEKLEIISNYINSMHGVIDEELKKKHHQPGFCVKDCDEKYKKKKKKKNAKK